MADKSLQVTISADVTSLQAKSAVAKVELASLNAEVKKLATEFTEASDTIKATLEPELEKAAAKAAAMKAEVASLSKEIVELSHSGGGGFFGSLTADMTELGEKAESITGKLTVFQDSFAKISELAAAGFAGEWIGEQINQVAELGESYAHMSEQTGATLRQLGALKVAASETGTDFETLGTGFRELQIKMQDALIHPTGDAAQAFKKMNISITDSAGNLLPVVDVFEQISKAMAGYQDGTAKTVLAGDTLGSKYGSQLIPIMNLLGVALAEVTQKGDDLGVTMSESGVQASEEFKQAQGDLHNALIGLRNTVVESNLPAFSALEQEFVTNAKEGGVFSDGAKVLELALKVVGDAAVAVTTTITEIGDALNFTGEVMGDVALAAYGLSLALEGDFAHAQRAVQIATADIGNSWHDMLTKMSSEEALFSKTDADLWNGLPADAEPKKAELPDAPQLSPEIPKAARRANGVDAAKSAQEQMTQISEAAASARNEIVEAEFEAQKSTWQSEVTQGKISKTQEVQDEIAAQQKIYAAQLAEAEQAAALDKAGSVAKAKALDDVAVMQAKHVATMAELNNQLVNAQVQAAKEAADAQKAAADASAAAWQRVVQPINSAFDTSINGVIQGTQTLRNAEAKAAQSIALAFIDAEAKKVLAFAEGEARIEIMALASQLKQSAAVKAATAEQLATKATGAAAGKAIDTATVHSSILASAGQAAAGAMAAVAGIPYVGPVLAPVAGAATYAAVVAYDVLSAAGGLQVGAGEEPVVQLHEKETVLPAHIASPLETFLAGGNTNHDNSSGDTHITNHFNVTAPTSGSAGDFTENVGTALNNLIRSGSLQRYPALARAVRR